MYHLGRELEGGDDGDNGNIWNEDTLRKEIELIRLKARDIVVDAMDPAKLAQYAQKAERAITNEIEKPVDEAIVEVTKRLRFPLTQDEVKAATENVLEGGKANRNQWGLANGLNWLTHSTENVDRQYELERLAAEVIELKPGDWAELAN